MLGIILMSGGFFTGDLHPSGIWIGFLVRHTLLVEGIVSGIKLVSNFDSLLDSYGRGNNYYPSENRYQLKCGAHSSSQFSYYLTYPG